MAEAVDRVGKFPEDVGIEVGCNTPKRVEVWLHEAGKLLEDAVLILHLHHEACSLEQALAVPVESGHRCWIHGDRLDRAVEPLVEEGNVTAFERDALVIHNQTIVLVVEDCVERCEARVFVDAAIAGNEVGVEQFVVVESDFSSFGGDHRAIDIC